MALCSLVHDSLLFPLSPGRSFVCPLQMPLRSSAVLTPAALVADTSLTHSSCVGRAAKGKVILNY